MAKQEISGLEFAQKLVSVWNGTHGSEWNSRAGGFVKARIFNKKQGEIRVYFGDGYLKLAQVGSSVAGKFSGFKYGIQDQVEVMVSGLLEQYRCTSLLPQAKQVIWLNEDGQEVDELDPDAVVKKEVY